VAEFLVFAAASVVSHCGGDIIFTSAPVIMFTAAPLVAPGDVSVAFTAAQLAVVGVGIMEGSLH
jgi:hypothetical protein